MKNRVALFMLFFCVSASLRAQGKADTTLTESGLLIRRGRQVQAVIGGGLTYRDRRTGRLEHSRRRLEPQLLNKYTHVLDEGLLHRAGPGIIKVEDRSGHYAILELAGVETSVTTAESRSIRISSVQPSVDWEVEFLHSGAKETLILHTAAAPDTFRWRAQFSAKPEAISREGMIRELRIGDALAIPLPDAVDAGGRSIPAHWELSGPEDGYYSLQVVLHTDGAQFPVLLDPSILETPGAVQYGCTWTGRDNTDSYVNARSSDGTVGAYYDGICAGQRRDIGDQRYDVMRGGLMFPTGSIPQDITLDSLIVTLHDGIISHSSAYRWGPIATFNTAVQVGGMRNFPGWASGLTPYGGIIKFADWIADDQTGVTQSFKLNAAAADSFMTAHTEGRRFSLMWMTSADSAAAAPAGDSKVYYDDAGDDHPPQLTVYFTLNLLDTPFNGNLAGLSACALQATFQDSSKGRRGYYYAQPDGQILDWRPGPDSVLTAGVADSTFTFIDTLVLASYTPDFSDTVLVCVFDSTGPPPDTLCFLLPPCRTLALAPSQPTLESVSDSTVQLLFADSSGNPGTVQYAFYDSTLSAWRDTGLAVTAGLVQAPQTLWDSVRWAGYGPNARVRIGVFALNGDSVLTTGPGCTVYTWAAAPDTTRSVLIDSAHVQVTLSPDDNPAYTGFAVEDSVSGLFVDPASLQLRSPHVTEDSTWAFGTYAAWGGAAGVVITVTPGRDYYFRAYARDGVWAP